MHRPVHSRPNIAGWYRAPLLIEACRFQGASPPGGPFRTQAKDLPTSETGIEMTDEFEPYFDSNGVLSERLQLGDQEIIVHYDDYPDKDLTVVRGIPCTTALRTVIDIAPDVPPDDLEVMVQDCLDRRLFTLEEATERLAEDDMLTRPGAELLRRILLR
jgi:hypothetical protein